MIRLYLIHRPAIMGSALSSSIVEEELNGNSVSNTPAEERLLVMTKKNKELEQKVAWAEEKFNEMVEKNEEICKVNQVTSNTSLQTFVK